MLSLIAHMILANNTKQPATTTSLHRQWRNTEQEYYKLCISHNIIIVSSFFITKTMYLRIVTIPSHSCSLSLAVIYFYFFRVGPLLPTQQNHKYTHLVHAFLLFHSSLLNIGWLECMLAFLNPIIIPSLNRDNPLNAKSGSST